MTATSTPADEESPPAAARSDRRDGIIGTFVVVPVAVLVGVAVVAFLSDDPGNAVRTFLTGSLEGRYQLGNTVARATPYLFTGAALAISFRVGVFNLGAEGQLYLGAAAGTWVAIVVDVAGPVTILAACVAGAIAGGLWGAVPGWLRAYYGTNEIVVTLMLNFVAVLFVGWLVSRPLADPGRPGFPQSERIPDGAQLPRLLAPSTLHVGIIIGVIVCVAGHLIFGRTARGFKLRMAGQSAEFSRYVGLPPERSILAGMAVSGAVAGLGGAVHILGDQLRLLDGFSPGYGFVGILVALLARNHLLGVPLAALFYSWILSGAQVMEEATDVPREAVSVVQAVLFLLVTASTFTVWIRRHTTARTQATGAAT